ncbi:MAG: purine-nucleoside phosphorylase, partial [Anaerolineales bacterium]|nr:purine-nucleoside phosphorylase [Anaerolineales bacterium]
MGDFLTITDIQAAAAEIQKKISQKPRIGMILGSGLGALAESIENPEYVPYGEIPGWPISGVKGHAGRLVFG